MCGTCRTAPRRRPWSSSSPGRARSWTSCAKPMPKARRGFRSGLRCLLEAGDCMPCLKGAMTGGLPPHLAGIAVPGAVGHLPPPPRHARAGRLNSWCHVQFETKEGMERGCQLTGSGVRRGVGWWSAACHGRRGLLLRGGSQGLGAGCSLPGILLAAQRKSRGAPPGTDALPKQPPVVTEHQRPHATLPPHEHAHAGQISWGAS